MNIAIQRTGSATSAVHRALQAAIGAHAPAFLGTHTPTSAQRAIVPRFVASPLPTPMGRALERPEVASPERLQRTFGQLVRRARAAA